MKRTIPSAVLAASFVTLAFAACKGGSDWNPERGAPVPLPLPTTTASPPHDCADLGGTCEPAACEFGRGCGPSSVVCQSTPQTAECGDLGLSTSNRGPRCCVPLELDDAGWTKLSFDPECGLSIPYGRTSSLAPIHWEPCSPDLGARWPGCSWIRVDWPAGEGAYAGRFMDEALAGSFDKQYTDTRLVISRVAGPARYRMVANLEDNRIEDAFRETRPNCSMTHADLNGSARVFTVTRRDGEKIVKAGALWSYLEYLPYPGELPAGSEPLHFIHLGRIFTTPANVIKEYHDQFDGGVAVSYRPVPVEGTLGNVVLRGDVLLFGGRDPRVPKIEVFAGGDVRQLLGFGEDVTSGAADFGTDGRDMVWTEASGRATPGEPWSRIDIMSAAYTNVPELIGPTIQKRRLRSETSFGGAPFVVACGHAAHAVGTAGVRLVRVSDGQSWMLSNEGLDPTTSWRITSPLTMNCDEVIVRLRRGDEHQVARIPLSMLGPGEAAD